eukprot:COSAG02_NODE_57644_length_280_cov_0.569061_1_plen_25_part_10
MREQGTAALLTATLATLGGPPTGTD